MIYGISEIRVVLLLIACIIVFVCGINIFNSARTYQESIEEYEIENVMALAQSVAQNLNNRCMQRSVELAYLSGENRAIEAEIAYLQNDDSTLMERLVSENIIITDRVGGMLTVWDMRGNVIAASHKKETPQYFIGGLYENETEYHIINIPDKGIYLGVYLRRPSGITYGLCFDLEKEFFDVASNINISPDGYMVFFDDIFTVISFAQKGNLNASYYPEMWAKTEGSRKQLFALEQLVINTAKTKENQYTYDWTIKDAQTNVVHPAVLGSSVIKIGANKQIFVCAAFNRNALGSPLRDMYRRMLFDGTIIAMMLFAIVLMLMYSIFENRKEREALVLVKRKNEYLEKINQQTREMLHSRQLQNIGVMAAGVVHEFNNLLTPIMSNSFMLLEKTPPEEAEAFDCLLSIYNTSNKAKELIERIALLSRKNIELKHQLIHLERTIINSLSLINSYKPSSVLLELDFHCPEVIILGNANSLNQVFLNLCINAIQAIGEEKGALYIRTELDEKRTVRIEIEDTGGGVPSDDLSKIFDPFFTSKKAKGVGLGLSIVQSIIAEHGGTISVRNNRIGGATFTILLPIAES